METDLATTVSKLHAQNLSDNQIIQTLQYQGVNVNDITHALEAEKRAQHFNKPADPQSVHTMQQPQNPMGFQPQSTNQQQFNQNNPFPPGNMPQQDIDVNTDEIEQLIEAIIEEKWNEMKKSMDRLLSWKDQAENRITILTQQSKDLKEQFDKVHNAVLGKVGEYDKNIKEVGAQLQAMEKLFSDVLPTFTQNINTLNRITQKFSEQERQQ